jgi:hypothetical protein
VKLFTDDMQTAMAGNFNFSGVRPEKLGAAEYTNVDHYCTVGGMHVSQGTPCEDYALSGHLDRDAVFGAVSDGCSGARANTDVGARTIAFAFARTIQSRQVPAGEWFRGGFFDALRESFASSRITNSEDDHLATFVGFVAIPETASVFLMGDGEVSVWNTLGTGEKAVVDPAVTKDMRLFAMTDGVFYHTGRDVFRLSLS